VVENGRATTVTDRSLGMERIEVRCADCGARTWVTSSPTAPGLRYCINPAALDFAARAAEQEKGSDR
jgi:peptide-methionine (R)-S-oxide reductase